MHKFVPVTISAACFTLATLAPVAAFASPITIAPGALTTLSAATFTPLGTNSGIPNTAVKQVTLNGGALVIGLSATQRGIANPALTNDGVGTFTAQAGSDPFDPTHPERAKWNIDFFAGATSGSDLSAYDFILQYDTNAGFGTDTAAFGSWDLTNTPGYISPIQDSENLGFGFFNGSPSLAFITPPAGSFNSGVNGEYSFQLLAFLKPTAGSPAPTFLGSVAINVDTVGAQAVPEPGSLLLMGTGILAAAWRLRQRRG